MLFDYFGLIVVINNFNVVLILSCNFNINLYFVGGLVCYFDEDIVGEVIICFYCSFNIKVGIFGVGGFNFCG